MDKKKFKSKIVYLLKDYYKVISYLDSYDEKVDNLDTIKSLMLLNETKKKNKKTYIEKKGKGIPYIFKNEVHLGKRPQKGSGAISKIVARVLENVGNVIGI